MSSLLDRIADLVTGPMFSGMLSAFMFIINIGFGFGVRLMGPLFVMGLYFLVGLHVYAYFEVVLHVLKRRLGVGFGLVWCAIGLSLVYNVVFNHFMATIIKPGGPSDLKVKYID